MLIIFLLKISSYISTCSRPKGTSVTSGFAAHYENLPFEPNETLLFAGWSVLLSS